MKKLTMRDLVPMGGSFKLRLVNKTFKLRPFTLQDEIWLTEKFTTKEIEVIFSKVLLKEICQIVFHQLEDKSFFKTRNVKVVNEDGEEETLRLGGVKLLLSLVSGLEEKTHIAEAMLRTIGISKPLQAQIAKDEIASQKKKQHQPS